MPAQVFIEHKVFSHGQTCHIRRLWRAGRYTALMDAAQRLFALDRNIARSVSFLALCEYCKVVRGLELTL
jgi:hypothetical protein